MVAIESYTHRLIFAPLEVDTDWKTEINNIFQHVDKSKVQSGHLLDYAMEFTDITAYDGVLRDTNYLDLNVFGNIIKPNAPWQWQHLPTNRVAVH